MSHVALRWDVGMYSNFVCSVLDGSVVGHGAANGAGRCRGAQEVQFISNFSDQSSTQDIGSISANKIDLVQKLSLFLGSGYAVQIAALQSIEEITKLAEKIGIENPLIAETKLEGASWFVLVLDLYEEFESAEAAGRNLQRAYPFLNEPWVRPIKSLRKSLAKFSG